MMEAAFGKLMKILSRLGWVSFLLLAGFVVYGYLTFESWVTVRVAKAFSDPATNAAIIQYIDGKIKTEADAHATDLKRIEGKVDHVLEGLGELRGEMNATRRPR